MDQPAVSHRQQLGGPAATALVVGSMLGIGIFLAPPVVAKQIHGPGAFLLLWCFGGASSLCGALAVAELGAMLPRAGGDYPYLRRAYGPGLAFAAGWLQLLAVFPGSLAVMAVGTGAYQLPVILGDAWAVPAHLGLEPAATWAVLIVVALTAVNHLGVVISGRVQVAITVAPVLVLLVGSVVTLAHHGTDGGALALAGTTVHLPGPSALAVAFLPVYFAYSGWNAAIFVGGEVEQPGRNIPRSLIRGTLVVTTLYLVLCLGFLAVFRMEDLANAGEVGTAAARLIFGPAGEVVITVSIILAMLGSINGTVLTGSRIAFAMGRKGHCLPAAGRLSKRFGTPVVALWLQAAWTLVLVFTHTFDELMNYASAAMLITGSLTVLAVMVLRRKLPDLPRPYRVWGYPYTPLIYVLSSVAVLVVLAEQGDPSLFLGAAWFMGALGVHRLFLRDRFAGARVATSPGPGPGAPPADRGRAASRAPPKHRGDGS